MRRVYIYRCPFWDKCERTMCLGCEVNIRFYER